ncbi:hypothetical protein PM082_007120 [Marasmius tenuissimus]|nr:hypothetical protein PM082_007120 [Marasmius tenuissimus]
MSFSLPIEDLPRLKISVHASSYGEPMLSFNMAGPSSSQHPSLSCSGTFVNFQLAADNGGWCLTMHTGIGNMGFGEDVFNLDPVPMSALTSDLDIHASRSPSSTGTAVELNSETDSLLAWIDTQTEFAPTKSPYVNLPFLPPPTQTRAVTSCIPGVPEPISSPSLFATGLFPPYPTDTTLDSALTSPARSDSSEAEPKPSSERKDPAPPAGKRTRNSNRRSLPCLESTCPRQFTTEHTRLMHMQTHRPKLQASFPCTMGCSEQFSRRHDRFRHEVRKHGYRSEWNCAECSGVFSSERSLTAHKCEGKGVKWK